MYAPDETTAEMLTFRFDPYTTFVIPKSLMKVMPLKYLFTLASFYAGLSQVQRSDWKKLYELGFADSFKIDEEQAVSVLCSKNPQNVSDINNIDTKTCEWCKCSTYLLNEHHYPKRKKDKGNQVILICSNCHMEFHYLVDNSHYSLKKHIEDEFIDSLNEMRKSIIEDNQNLDRFLIQNGGIS